MQPIYIYKFELEHLNKYILLDTKNYNPEDKLFCIVNSSSLKTKIYINKIINKSYFTINWPTAWYNLDKVVSLNKKTKRFHLMSFNSLIDLLEQCNKSEYYEHITNVLQLIIAKWDDWY